MANQRNYFNHNTGKPVHYGSRMTGDFWIFDAESDALITEEDAEEMQKEAGMAPGGFSLKDFSCEKDSHKETFTATWKCVSSSSL